MDICYFNEFMELARIGSYTIAARNLHISQSALSKHMKQMEEEIGAALFLRRKNGIELSEYGSVLLPYAQQIIRSQDGYQESFLAMQEGGGILKVASIPAVRQLGIGEMIADFVSAHRKVRFHITEGESRDLIDLLRQQEADVAFARGEDDRFKELVRIPFITDRIACIMHMSHPLSTRDRIQLSELRYEDLIFPDHNTLLRGKLEEACRREGFEPSVVYSNNNGRHVIEMVKRCAGVALLNGLLHSKWLNEEKNRSVRIIPVDPPIETTVYLYYHPRQLTQIGRSFVDYVIERIRQPETEALTGS